MDRLAKAMRRAVAQGVDEAIRSPATAARVAVVVDDILNADGEPRNLTQFVFQIDREIARCAGKRLPDLLERGARAWHAFASENRVRYGDPGWDWNMAAARTIAHEYEIDCW